ncbi:MAG: PorV/PorQ family protein [Bacteroidota bacterium]|nr:PorV/PorQ family protein [Bacteroidota bacterium]
MKIKNINILIIIVLFSFVGNIFGGPKNKYGLSAARELLIPVGSVSTALGGANLASVNGVDALYWNPSGLSILSGKTGEVLFSNQIYIADINIVYFAGAYKIPNFGSLALSVNALNFGDIPVTTVTNPEGTGETFSPTYLTTGVSYARAMTDRISFGTTVKVIYEKISRESSTGIAFDFGLNYDVIGSGLRFGVALRNIGPSMSFSGPDLEQFFQPPETPAGTQPEPRAIELADFELPTSLSLGLSYDLRLDQKNNLIGHGTFQNNSFSTDDYNLGLEYNFNKIVYLRGGYQITDDTGDNNTFTGVTFGAGFKYSASNSFNIGFDYAYRLANRFEDNQFFTINLGF